MITRSPQYSAFLANSRVLDYQLIGRIGQGGNGIVYKGLQLKTNKVVAIKTICSQQPDYSQLKRLKNGARICHQLNHPNIVKMIDNVVLDGQPAVVYEFAGEQSLLSYLFTSEALRPVEIKELMLQVLEALCYMHRRQVVHGDIKPGNIMVSHRSKALHATLIDFGIGCLMYERDTLQSNDFEQPLSLSYCAPECLLGEPCSPGSDLYAWGLVLVECFIGRPLVPGNSLSEIKQWQLSSAEFALGELLHHEPLSSLMQRVLQKRPENRVLEPTEVLEDLKSIDFDQVRVSAIQPDDFILNDTVEIHRKLY